MISNIKKSLSNHFSFFDDKYKVSIALAITLSTITRTSLFNEIDTYEILLFNFFCFTSMLFIFFTLANKLTIYLAYRKMTSNLEKELAKTIILLFRTKINSKQQQEQGKGKMSTSNKIKLSILIILGIISNYIFFERFRKDIHILDDGYYKHIYAAFSSYNN